MLAKLNCIIICVWCPPRFYSTEQAQLVHFMESRWEFSLLSTPFCWYSLSPLSPHVKLILCIAQPILLLSTSHIPPTNILTWLLAKVSLSFFRRFGLEILHILLWHRIASCIWVYRKLGCQTTALQANQQLRKQIVLNSKS